MNKQLPYNPHKQRRTNVHGMFLIIGLIMLLIYAYGCSPQKSGCYGTRGMSGYGYCPTLDQLRKSHTIPYLYCPNTGLICVLDMKGKIVCSYYHPAK